jgi:branched-chain amino acid transport system substrate-binding protein
MKLALPYFVTTFAATFATTTIAGVLTTAAFIAGAVTSGNALAADTIRIGYMSTLSGPGAGIGNDIRDGFNLALKNSGNKLGGLNVDLMVVDDQQKPDVGVQGAQRLVQQHKSDIITGVVFSNVLLAAVPAILENKTFYISPNTGPADYAGAKCNPYFFVASWQNEDIPGAMGKFVSDRGLKNVMLIGANYAGGKESIAGFKRYFTGTIVDELYTPMNQLDYSSELAAIQAKKPDGVFAFLPGGLGINFLKQYAGAGIAKSTQLFLPGFSADEDTIKPVGAALLGTVNSSHWAHDLDNPQNRKFVADFEAEYKRLPSLYASQGYDTAALIDSAVRKIGGKIENKDALRKALEAADFKSVRGAFKFNTNHYPIQDYYLRVVRQDDKGRITNRMMGKIFTAQADPFAKQCSMK